ncbi:MAG: hypothetical protein DCF20_20990 [Pseudanabaena sp.]|nr:MAG: hypothetical protein DCF20_20990 [Pseudanabaena sp.]
MSKEISFRQFCVFVCFYAIGSLIVYLTTSFSSLAWIVAFFSLIPFYGVCVIWVLIAAIKKRNAKVRYYKAFIPLILIIQAAKILSSPASCYGWSQGNSCYSLLQLLLDPANLKTLSNTPPHWLAIESMFPVALILYMISVAAFLLSLRFQEV